MASEMGPKRPFQTSLTSLLRKLSERHGFLRPHLVLFDPETGMLRLSLADARPREGHSDYAPGVGVVRFETDFWFGAHTSVWELVSYRGVGEGYFPIIGGLFRRYEPVDISGPWHGALEHTYVEDESGVLVLHNGIGQHGELLVGGRGNGEGIAQCGDAVPQAESQLIGVAGTS